MVENLRTLDAAVVDGACGASRPEHDMDASRDVFYRRQLNTLTPNTED